MFMSTYIEKILKDIFQKLNNTAGQGVNFTSPFSILYIFTKGMFYFTNLEKENYFHFEKNARYFICLLFVCLYFKYFFHFFRFRTHMIWQ